MPRSVNMDFAEASWCGRGDLSDAIRGAEAGGIRSPQRIHYEFSNDRIRTFVYSQSIRYSLILPMNPLPIFWRELIYRPLFNALVFIYVALPFQDLGLAIFVLTFAVRLALHPFIVQTVRSQQAMARVSPKLKEIQTKFKNDREVQARETMALYRAEGAHPLSGCLPLLVQLPILIGLYQVFWKGIAFADASLLYSFLPAFSGFNPVSLGVFNLAERSAALAIAAGISQFFQAKFLPQPVPTGGGRGDFGRALAWQTTYILPLFIIVFSWSLPSALAFYWTVLNLLAIVQQLIIQKRLKAPGS